MVQIIPEISNYSDKLPIQSSHLSEFIGMRFRAARLTASGQRRLPDRNPMHIYNCAANCNYSFSLSAHSPTFRPVSGHRRVSSVFITTALWSVCLVSKATAVHHRTPTAWRLNPVLKHHDHRPSRDASERHRHVLLGSGFSDSGAVEDLSALAAEFHPKSISGYATDYVLKKKKTNKKKHGSIFKQCFQK